MSDPARTPNLIYLPSDDPLTPNNKLPLVVHRDALDVNGSDPASIIEARFSQNGWKDLWRNGVFDFEHYHSTAHEVLGVGRGSARVRFGGAKGEVLDLRAGDVLVLPAGTGHCRISCSGDFLVVGGYPRGVTCDLIRATSPATDAVRARIAAVPLPEADPVLGKGKGIVKMWSACP